MPRQHSGGDVYPALREAPETPLIVQDFRVAGVPTVMRRLSGTAKKGDNLCYGLRYGLSPPPERP